MTRYPPGNTHVSVPHESATQRMLQAEELSRLWFRAIGLLVFGAVMTAVGAGTFYLKGRDEAEYRAHYDQVLREELKPKWLDERTKQEITAANRTRLRDALTVIERIRRYSIGLTLTGLIIAAVGGIRLWRSRRMRLHMQ